MDQRVDSTPPPGPHADAPSNAAAAAARLRLTRPRLGLPGKLLLLTTLFVMLAEVLIFVPSVSSYRINWLMDRLRGAQLASLAADASPSGVVPPALRMELLRTAQVRAVALKRNDQRLLILSPDMPLTVDASFDLSMLARGGAGPTVAERIGMIFEAVAVLFRHDDRMLRITGAPNDGAGDTIEVVLPERPLRNAMMTFGLNILALSIIISIITAALVYAALSVMLVRPMMRIADNMQRFSARPEDRSRIIRPSTRTDEIGVAERELASMQGELVHLLQQKNRLAALGMAVSKINHDLRNLLANTQLLSDRLTSSPDPTVQSFAPKLIASLDRAIAFCNNTLHFGRAEELPPRREVLRLRPLVEEVGEGLGIGADTRIALAISIEEALTVDADRDQLYRVLSNLCRNSAQALEGYRMDGTGRIAVAAERRAAGTLIRLEDDGPGVPAKARAHLFQAFQGSVRKGGTGLGLAIARELIVAHGGDLRLVESKAGAVFEIEIPDRDETV